MAGVCNLSEVRAWIQSEQCGEPLLELTPSSLPITTFTVCWSTDYCTEVPESSQQVRLWYEVYYDIQAVLQLWSSEEPSCFQRQD